MAAPERYQGTRTVYDSKNGVAVSLNPIDARERVACGLATFEPKPLEPEPAAAPEPVADPEPAADDADS